MVSRPFAILTFVILTLSLFPSALASTPATDGNLASEEAWWKTWPSDMDRDGVHDWLEDLTAEALAEDPDARLDIIVDLDRTPTARDVDRLEALGMEVQFVSRYVDAVAGSLPASVI
jgi:hypothetical protein